MAKYLRVEELHVKANDEWTKRRQRAGQMNWTHSFLASVVINAIPEATDSPFSTEKIPLARALSIRAIYRLCGSLFMVGGGARSDVFALLDDARCKQIYWLSLLSTESCLLHFRRPMLTPVSM